MFYQLSKIFWFLFQPLHLLIFLLILGILVQLAKYRQAGLVICSLVVFSLVVICFSPIGFYLLSKMEDEVPNYQSMPEYANEDMRIDGIIVLAGGIDWLLSMEHETIEFTNAADRYLHAIALWNQNKDAKFVHSGRVFSKQAEQEQVKLLTKFFISVGIPSQNIIVESASRNTREHPKYLVPLLSPKANENWVVVTSAFHMPRVMDSFAKYEWNVLPYPVDYRTTGSHGSKPWFYNSMDYLASVHLYLKELMGRAVYELFK